MTIRSHSVEEALGDARGHDAEHGDGAVPLLGLEPASIENNGQNPAINEDPNLITRLAPLLGTICSDMIDDISPSGAPSSCTRAQIAVPRQRRGVGRQRRADAAPPRASNGSCAAAWPCAAGKGMRSMRDRPDERPFLATASSHE